jgi:hypothetical protein
MVESVRLVEPVSFRPLMSGLQDEHVATAPASLVGARVQQSSGRAAPPEPRVDVEIGNPGLRSRPVQPWLDPEADRARDLAVQLGDEDLRVRVLEVGQEDFALRLRVVRDGGSRQTLHQREDSVGVPRLGRSHIHAIDRYRR